MPTYPLPDTLLVDGTDLKTLPGVRVGNMAGLLAPGRRRGEDLRIPGRNGLIGTADLPYDAYAFDFPITIIPEAADETIPTGIEDQRAQTLTNLYAIAAALTPGLVTLTRRLVTASGYVDHTAAGRFVDGLQLAWFNPLNGRTVLQFVNLDGGWTASDGSFVVP